ncbi:hypothetical protein BGZ79_000786 [Entomortierella chlamydospora]|nr:hypothetical protein BGZ79_000786 [Entomortierella chlamydospora]
MPKNLTLEEKALIVGMLFGDKTGKEIADKFASEKIIKSLRKPEERSIALALYADYVYIVSAPALSTKAPIVVIRRISLIAEPKQKSNSLSPPSINTANSSNSGGSSYSNKNGSNVLARRSLQSLSEGIPEIQSSGSRSNSGSRARRSSMTALEYRSMNSTNRSHHGHHHHLQPHHTDRYDWVYITSDLPRGRPFFNSSTNVNSSSSSLDMHKTSTASSTASSISIVTAITLHSNYDQKDTAACKPQKSSKLRRIGRKIRSIFSCKSNQESTIPQCMRAEQDSNMDS